MNVEQEPAADPQCPAEPAFTPAAVNTTRKMSWSIPARFLGAVCILAALRLGMPFASDGSLVLAEVNGWLMIGTFLVTLVSLGYAAAETCLRNAFLLFALSFTVTWAVEAGGVRWGVPFGWPYRYHEALQPQLWGGVPLFIPLAWYVLLRVPVILLRRWNTGPDAGGRNSRQVLRKAVACGVFMGGCSLMLEPLGVALGAWTWSRPGDFFGVPVLNGFGWALVGFTVHAAYLALERRQTRREPPWLQQLEREMLIGSLLFHGLAFVAIANRVHSWLPTVLAVITMGPLWVFWFVSNRRQCR